MSVYYGESGHSAYFRLKFHVNGLRRKAKSNVLFAHQEEYHQGTMMDDKDFKMTLEDNFSRAILRQSFEGVSIARAVQAREAGANVWLLNSKREFFQPGVVRPKFAPVLDQE